jgi:hypothetical protein
MWNWRVIVKQTLIYGACMIFMIGMMVLGTALSFLDELPAQKKIRIHKEFKK